MSDSPIAAAPAAIARRRLAPEPNRAVPLRWGGYRSRQLSGLMLICGGAGLILPANASTIGLALLGSALHLVGWSILPARGWRRVWAAGPSMLALWFTVLGARTLFLLALPLLLWLLVRRRRLPTYALVALPVIANLWATTRFGIFERPPVVLAGVAAVVLAAWVAALASRVLGWPSKRAHSGNSPDER
ncbi:hypothetical protein [Naasia lichenicola]|uniref:Uncharacterized protein n=1 Tax=Naasia lichenicola TaxID=2565933 RepID=A0A4S4FHL0_9MICO|nr:hypothetical protein [Naasia lichenicola]THG29769.1 hypothetical protein E6C64_13980 [Naasia lichenicola]